MIHYHGTPITPNDACFASIKGGHAFVSFNRPDQLGIVIDACQSFAVDNGAFSAWKSGNPVTDWRRYYEWVARLQRFPSFDFAVIPDVIDGTEQDNDRLLDEWPWRDIPKLKSVGAPVWHMHESFSRLMHLAHEWPRICTGSSGDYSVVGDGLWWQRMNEAMSHLCDKQGNPICKIHGLRMLNVNIFAALPLSSADSTNIAQNIGIDSKWRGTYTPASKSVRALVIRDRIESVQSLTFWDKNKVQEELELI